MRAVLFALSLFFAAATAPALAVTLPTWGVTWTYKGITYSNDRMVGNTPGSSGSTTNAYIIPVDLVVNGLTFTTSTLQPNGPSALVNTLLSPLFSDVVDFKQPGHDFGTTQYLDAFERGNYWFQVKKNPNYHFLLNPVGVSSVTITVPAADGHVGVNHGIPWAYVDNHWLKAELQLILAANPQITPTAVPIFLTYDTFLINPNVAAGLHDTFGNQTYIIATYGSVGSGSVQDVAVLSHELGEWANDPFHHNSEPCGGILEDADPLDGINYPYTVTETILNTFTFHLQDLVYLNYFGAPTSLNGELSFQNESLSVCSNGP